MKQPIDIERARKLKIAAARLQAALECDTDTALEIIKECKELEDVDTERS